MVEERVKPRAMFVEEAIQLALESRWEEAVGVNRTQLDKHGPDEDAFNRLGKALLELGSYQEALDAYNQTLQLNPLNVIAQKNSRKLAAILAADERLGGATAAIDVDLFTEDPGKSALTVLTPPVGGVTVTVAPGDAVELEPRGGTLNARTIRGIDLGDVDTKIGRRILPLMRTGNRYSAAVARVEEKRIEIMIREVFQAPENSRKTSFPIARGKAREEFRPYAKESLLAARGADYSAESEDEDGLEAAADGGEEDMEGLQPVEGELEEAAFSEPDDEPDEDERPEDSY